MTSTIHPAHAATPAAAPAAAEPIRRPRTTIWPYAGLVSAVSGFGSVSLLSQGSGQFKADKVPTTQFILDNLNDATVIKLGGAAALISVVAGMLFLIGLTRFVEALVPGRRNLHTAMRMSSTAFVATASIGVMMRYVIAGGAKGGIDKNLYTHDAVATLSALCDQIACASALPVLVVMALVGWVGFRDRVLARPVAVAALLLAAVSTAATLVLGLPYSSYLVYPVFAAIVGVNGIASRRAA
jgi:hypothetical protein